VFLVVEWLGSGRCEMHKDRLDRVAKVGLDLGQGVANTLLRVTSQNEDTIDSGLEFFLPLFNLVLEIGGILKLASPKGDVPKFSSEYKLVFIEAGVGECEVQGGNVELVCVSRRSMMGNLLAGRTRFLRGGNVVHDALEGVGEVGSIEDTEEEE
jgi:hypothetical protein